MNKIIFFSGLLIFFSALLLFQTIGITQTNDSNPSDDLYEKCANYVTDLHILDFEEAKKTYFECVTPDYVENQDWWKSTVLTESGGKGK